MKKKKTYAVFGLGRYGISVAKELVSNGMEVLAVDIDENLIPLFIAILYNNEKNRLKINVESAWFELLLGVGVFSIIFDGLSAYTVNDLIILIINLCEIL